MISITGIEFHPRSYSFAEWLCKCGQWICWSGWTDKREPKVSVSCDKCGTVRHMG